MISPGKEWTGNKREGKGKSHEQTGKQEGRRKGKGEKTGRVKIKGVEGNWLRREMECRRERGEVQIGAYGTTATSLETDRQLGSFTTGKSTATSFRLQRTTARFLCASL